MLSEINILKKIVVIFPFLVLGIDVMEYCRNQVVVSNFQCRISKLQNYVGLLFQISVAKWVRQGQVGVNLC